MEYVVGLRFAYPHTMPAHYLADWWMAASNSSTEAKDTAYVLFDQLRKIALTCNVLMPVGTDIHAAEQNGTPQFNTTGVRATPGHGLCAGCRESSSRWCAQN
ncbi:hypothetical protein [Mycobacterium uberis]|uniref:hypothetical protein n=1 Tax=Mycobacterium uberis TaxID=2162698 RepID=UPI0026791A45